MYKKLKCQFIHKKIFAYTLCFWFIFNSSVDAKLYPEKKYDWNVVLNVPPDTECVDGYQILHFKSKNKHFSLNKEATKFVNEHLVDAKSLDSDAEVLQYASEQVELKEGEYLEMGVCTGKTINFIAALNPHHVIYGFDSFEGLPVDWIRDDKTIKKETFSYKDSNIVPPVLHNVLLYKGFFDKILPKFKKNVLKDNPIAFLHIDCDIYESTRDVLFILKENLVPGSVIVFDELYNYPGFHRHEWKALNEFLKRKKLKAKFLAYNPYHQQVAIKLIDNVGYKKMIK